MTTSSTPVLDTLNDIDFSISALVKKPAVKSGLNKRQIKVLHAIFDAQDDIPSSSEIALWAKVAKCSESLVNIEFYVWQFA
jgi:hypothetical protein